MRKKKKHKENQVKPDRIFDSVIVSKLINKVMRNGEKRTATRIVYQAAAIIEKWFKETHEKRKKESSIVKEATETKKTEKEILKEKKEIELTEPIAEENQAKESLKITSFPFLTVFEGALANIKPAIEMKSRRIGASKQRIPKEIDDNRSLKIALRWLVEGAKKRKEEEKKKPHPKFEMFENLAEEIKNAYNKSGEAVKKKETLYKEAESGKVFSFYPESLNNASNF